MNYDYVFNGSMEEQIEGIIDACDKLDGDEKITVFDFGENKDLVLHIYKDDEYNRKANEHYCNLVTISVALDGVFIVDVDDTYVTDGALYKELEQIWNVEDILKEKLIEEFKECMNSSGNTNAAIKNIRMFYTEDKYYAFADVSYVWWLNAWDKRVEHKDMIFVFDTNWKSPIFD